MSKSTISTFELSVLPARKALEPISKLGVGGGLYSLLAITRGIGLFMSLPFLGSLERMLPRAARCSRPLAD